MALTPLTVAADTAAHIDYQQLKAKHDLINGSQEESKTNEREE